MSGKWKSKIKQGTANTGQYFHRILNVFFYRDKYVCEEVRKSSRQPRVTAIREEEGLR